MKSACSMSLALCLAATSAWAQRPIATAVAHAVVRLAAVSDGAGPPIDQIKAGNKIITTTPDSAPRERYVIAVNDDGSVMVLDLTSAALPGKVAGLLQLAALHHPDHFVRAQAGERFFVAEDVTLSPEGVVVRGQRVATLGQLLQTIARRDLETGTIVGADDATGPNWARRHPAVIGALIGLSVGIAGAAVVVSHCNVSCGDSGSVSQNFFFDSAVFGGVASGVGAVIGASIGALHHDRRLMVQP